MQKLRKFLAVSVMSMTILSTTMLAVPMQVGAAAMAGDLIKIDGYAPVYYLGADGKRYVFPNVATYNSWYSDFSKVKTLPQSEVESYPLAANVVMRAGTKLIKRPVPTDPKVYAVLPGAKLLWVADEATAKALYGNDWAKKVVDVVDSFFVNYTIQTGQVSATTYPAGSLVKYGTGADVYYVNVDGTVSKIANEAAFLANNLNWNNIISTALSMPTKGSDITAMVNAIADTSQGGGATGPVARPGVGTGLTVSLSSDTPASASVPKNGARIPMAKVNMTAANDGAVTVSSLTIKRTGLSSYTEVSNVWAEKNGITVASKKSVNSNDEAILTFSPALVIAQGTTVSVDIIASLNNAGGNIALAIANASAVTTDGAAVSGSFPVSGNLMSPITYEVTDLGIYNVSSTNLTPKVGDEKAELGKFVIGFNGTAKDVTLQNIMVKNNGVEELSKTAMNMYLEYNGEKVTRDTVVNGRFVTFTFNEGFALLKDDTEKTFYIKGDVISKEVTTGNSYVFVLNKSTDLSAYETSTGFGVNVYNASSGATLADARAISTVVIQSGVITVSKKSDSPAAKNIVKGSDNTVLLANVKADEAINVDGLKVIYGSVDGANATTTDQFENVRVYVNGLLVDSFDPIKDTGAVITKELSSSFGLKKGDNLIEVKVKAKTTAASGAKFYAKLDSASIFDGQNAEYDVTGNAVSGSDISGSATGAIFTVEGAALTTVRNDGFATNKVIVKGSNDVTVGKFRLQALNDDVKVTSIAFGANASSTNASSINNAMLYVDGVKTGNTMDFGASGATFSSLNFTIPQDTTKTIEVKMSFDSSATGGFKTTMTVNAQDSRGTAITSGNTADTTTFSVAAAGTLTVALGGDTAAAAILAASDTMQEVAQFKFTAVNDSATLGDITFANTSSSTASVATNAADSLVSGIYLFDGTTQVADTVLVNGEGTFKVADKVVVPANGNKTLTVKVKFNAIDNDATATNKDLRIVLNDVDFKSSAGTVTTQTEDEIANNFRIRKTVPTVVLQALPETLLTAGDKVVSKFTVAANATGDVTLGKIVLTYATTTNSSIAGMASNAVKINGVTESGSATTLGAGKTLVVTFDTPKVIAAGTSKTFEVYATVSVSGGDAESITTKIVEDASYSTGATIGAVTGSFIWSDGASITDYTYSNGHRVPGLTTNTQTLSK